MRRQSRLSPVCTQSLQRETRFSSSSSFSPLRLIALFVIACSTGAFAAIEIPQIRSYQTGEIAESDISTPVPLIVTESEAPRKRAPQPQSVVYVQDTAAPADAQAQLRSAVAKMREDFLDKLVLACNYRQLTPQQAQHPGFARFVTWFQNQHKSFPLTAELAEAWAIGAQDPPPVAPWKEALSEATKFLLVSALPDPALQIHLIATEDRKKLQWGNLAECLGSPANIAQFRTVADARKQLLRAYSDDPKTGEFLAQFLKENCLPDQSLSSLAEWSQKPPAEPTEPVQRSYKPGQIIVARGQMIDASAKAAIDMLRAKREQANPEANRGWGETLPRVAEPAKPFVASAVAWTKSRWETDSSLMLGISTALIIVSAAWLIIRIESKHPSTRIRSKESAYTVVLNAARKETVFLPVMADPNPRLLGNPQPEQPRPTPSLHIPAIGYDLPDNEPASGHEHTGLPGNRSSSGFEVAPGVVMVDWERRVEETERRAQELLEKVRAGLAPYLAREMMSDLVQKLIADRMGLIQAQNIAAREIALLEERFAKIHAELQQRLQLYQERNAFLEQKLAERTEESQELIKTQIAELEKRLQHRT